MTSAASEMSKAEGSKVLDENINIKCIDQSGREVFFKLKTTTPFSKMFDAYATKTKLHVAGLRFLFDGTRVNSSDTPEKLQMEDGDVIDIYMEQVGGGDDVHDNIRVPRAEALERLDEFPTDEDKRWGWPNLKRACPDVDGEDEEKLVHAANAVEQSVLLAESLVKRNDLWNADTEKHSSRSDVVLKVAKMIHGQFQQRATDERIDRVAGALDYVSGSIDKVADPLTSSSAQIGRVASALDEQIGRVASALDDVSSSIDNVADPLTSSSEQIGRVARTLEDVSSSIDKVADPR